MAHLKTVLPLAGAARLPGGTFPLQPSTSVAQTTKEPAGEGSGFCTPSPP